MTKQDAIKDFISIGISQYDDYWSMQESWTLFVDNLVRDGQVSDSRASNWGNPTTPEKFKAWKKRNS